MVVIPVVEARAVVVAKTLVLAVSPRVGTLAAVASPLVPMATIEKTMVVGLLQPLLLAMPATPPLMLLVVMVQQRRMVDVWTPSRCTYFRR
ncbi:unnamed protein product, partial [Ectocarpus sp. 8 AP-2014]